MTVAVGVVSEDTLELSANYGVVNVQTKPKATIFIDGVKVGNDTYTGRIITGLHTFETQLEYYNPDKKDMMIELGDSISLQLTPQPQLGDIDVASNPMETVIYLNGERKGVTPLRIKKVLAGEYEIKFEKEGYNSITKKINVHEGKPAEVNETLSLKRDEEGYVVKENMNVAGIKNLMTTQAEKNISTTRRNKVWFLQYSFSQYTNLGIRYGSARGAGLYISGHKSSKSSDIDAKIITAGLLFRFGRNLYMYTGAGYNKETNRLSDISVEGPAFDGGFILRLGPIAASAGLILHKDLQEETQKVAQFGVGFCFGK